MTMSNPTPLPEIEIGDTVKTERGHQFKVREILRIDPGHSMNYAQGARVRLVGRHGQSALDVAVTQVTRRIWRREEPR